MKHIKPLNMKKHLLIAFLFMSMFKTFAQPTITTFAPTSGAIGTTVIITGTNFNTTPENNIVFFGATKATVSAGSSTSLTVTVPSGASYQPISVTNLTNGLTAYSSIPFNTTFPFCETITSSSFATKENLTTGRSPYSVSTGDLDGDGKIDLAVANASSNTVSVFRNTSSSSTVSFAAKLDFTTGNTPVSVSICDLNGDFRLDLVVANTNSNTVSVFRNSGGSGRISFDTKVDFTTGTNPSSVSTGDFNGDGKLDLAISNRGSNSVSVFRNTISSSGGTISFAAKVDYSTGINPQSVSTGDLDGDGKTDIAIANYGSDSVSVFSNTSNSGTISFAAKVDFITGTNPNSISIGDLDVDGKLDLAIVNATSSSVSVFRNTSSSGTISFANKVDFTLFGPISVSIGNLDGDSKPDLAASSSSGFVYVFRNTSSSGTISFATRVDFTTEESRGISIGDLDGDGKQDIAFTNATYDRVSVIINLDGICFPTITSFSPTSGPIGTTVIITGTKFNTTPANNIVYFGATKATVTASTETSLTVIVPMGARYQPITVTNITYGLTAYSSQSFIPSFACGGIINTNSFDAKVDFTAGTSPRSVSSGDFDGDGKTDVAVGNTSNSVSVFRNTSSSGTISFANKVDFTAVSESLSVVIDDFDGDGKLDLANTISVFRNTSSIGTISFAAKVDFNTGGSAISAGDFDGDGKTDLAITNDSANTISVFRNTSSSGTISFAAKVDFTTGGRSISIGDFDGDGKTDLAVTNYSANTISVFRNTSSSGGTISFAAKVDFTTGGTLPRSISIGDLDGDGMLDLAIANGGYATVSVFRNTGRPGTISFASKVDFLSGETTYSISIVDLDGDGKLDLAVANSNSTVSVFKNTASRGTISFATKVDFTTGSLPMSISNGDFDGDGKLDLAVANNSSNSVSVLKNAVKSLTVTGSASVALVCKGDSVTLTGGGANTYGWTGGVINGVAFVPPIGTTTYTVTGTNTATGCQNTASITITVNTLLPTVTANASATTVCEGEAITLTSGGTANSYTWSGGVTNGVPFVPPTGTTTYTVTGTKDGCRNTAIKTITVNPLPTVTANATATTICAGDTITLTGGGTADTYAWSNGVTNGVPFVPPTGTIYTVTGTNTTTGCENTDTKNIIVNPIPSLNITANKPNSKCSGTCDGAITIDATDGKSPYSYKWNALANNQTTQTATGLCPDKYTVTITDANGCKFNTEVVLATDSGFNEEVYLTNIAAVDQVNVSPAFASYYTYNLPAKITPNPTNLRNFVDPGKKARFKVECTNKKANGKSIVSGVCQVRSNCPYITITDASSALNNIGWNNKAWSADEFEIDIKPNTPPGTIAYIDFIVLENGVEYPTTCIPLPITPLNYSPTTSATIDDDDNPDSKGNDNDICEPNEIIEFYPWLDNVSALNAEFVRGRFENLDNLSYINIWNNKAGVNTTVFDSTWWNFSFAQPAIINSNSTNMTPEFDFVFEYNNPNIVNNFKLYLVMAGGFKLFPGNALSLVQWSLPYTFDSSSLAVEGFLNDINLLIYPNPTNSFLNIKSNNDTVVEKIVITDLTGKKLLEQTQNTNQINVQNLAHGIYMLEATINDITITRKFIKQ